MRAMLVTLAMLGIGCDPPDSDPTGQEPPPPRGELVIDGVIWQLYQDGDRLEQVPVLDKLPDGLDPALYRRCGHLDGRAMEDIRAGIARLDLTHDYNREVTDCSGNDEYRRFHLPGFEHSPFACSAICCGCCAPDLARVHNIYAYAIENLHGQSLPDGSGEPYVAIDPERPCER